MIVMIAIPRLYYEMRILQAICLVAGLIDHKMRRVLDPAYGWSWANRPRTSSLLSLGLAGLMFAGAMVMSLGVGGSVMSRDLIAGTVFLLFSMVFSLLMLQFLYSPLFREPRWLVRFFGVGNS
jgi:hypothetical protein